MSISRRLRYEVLRRDGFQCRYCHRADVPLTVDHVIPVALGGSDEPDNLVAACAQCNAGKSSVQPGAPLVADVAKDAERWAAAMARAAELERRDRRAFEAALDALAEAFESFWSAWAVEGHAVPLPDDFRFSLETFITLGLTRDDLSYAVGQAMERPQAAGFEWKYFCGVCWRLIRERQKIARDIVDGEA